MTAREVQVGGTGAGGGRASRTTLNAMEARAKGMLLVELVV